MSAAARFSARFCLSDFCASFFAIFFGFEAPFTPPSRLSRDSIGLYRDARPKSAADRHETVAADEARVVAALIRRT